MNTDTRIGKYLANKSWLLKENANQNKSYSQMKGLISGEDVKVHSLASYPEHIRFAHTNGDFKIHDLSNGVVPYCNGIDLLNHLELGLVCDRIVSRPPKHLSTALNQVTNRFCLQQQEWAGAQAVGDFNTLLAPFVRIDNLTFKQVRAELERFVFDLNYPSRSAFETPFTNVMFNTKCPEHLAEISPILYPDLTYADFDTESEMIMDAFNDVLLEGDGAGNPFTFPIPTINLIPSTDFKKPVWLRIAETTAKYGSYSFMNYIGSGIPTGSKRAMCCRVILDMDEIATAGGRWAFEGSTGSIGVVTLNLARLAFTSDNESEFYGKLYDLLELAKESLEIKAKWCQYMLDEGYLPITKYYGIDFDRYFRTIGVLGIDEMSYNMTGQHIDEDPQFAYDVMKFIRSWTRESQKKTGTLTNFEMTPGESTASWFAYKDKKLYPEIFVRGTDENPYYSAMFVPSDSEINMWEKIEIEQEILSQFTGGTISRIFLGERQPDPESMLTLIENIARFTSIPYFDFASIFSVCQNTLCKKRIRKEETVCPQCGGSMRTYARIVGYFRDISRANDGKVEEIRNRHLYSVD